MSAGKEISVVIPSARSEQVRNTIAALQKQIIDVEFEIVVVTPRENKEKSYVGERVRYVFVDELYPPGRMRNIGAANTDGKYICFIDDDCIPGNRFLQEIHQKFSEYPVIGVVGCRVTAGETGFWPQCADYCLFGAYQYRKEFYSDLGSAAIMAKRNVFDLVRGFDEDLKASEDWDFSLKVREVGFGCLFTPFTEVAHFHGRNSFQKIIVNSYRSGKRSGLEVQKKHSSKMSWLAKLSLKFQSPYLYWIVIIPYAGLVTVFQAKQFWRPSLSSTLGLPVLFISHISYHIGVFKKLISGNQSIGKR